jgi:hypothetical protein
MGNLFYQNLDTDIIDYKIYDYQGLELRGPKLSTNKYIAYIGASQTFGRYCQEPYPHLLEKRLNMGTLNFGIGGKGPTYFLRNKIILEAVNKAELVIIQVLSGRSISNSVFESRDGGMHGIRLIDGKKMRSDYAFSELISGKDNRGLSREFMENLVKETRENYVSATIEFLKAIQPPKVLLWLSTRTPEYKEIYGLTPYHKFRKGFSTVLEQLSHGRVGFFRRYTTTPFNNLLAEFPHLVNREMIEEIKPYCDRYVECVSKTGLPQVLSDFQGNIVGKNNYYPSPEMHQQASELLFPVCKSILEKA